MFYNEEPGSFEGCGCGGVLQKKTKGSGREVKIKMFCCRMKLILLEGHFTSLPKTEVLGPKRVQQKIVPSINLVQIPPLIHLQYYQTLYSDGGVGEVHFEIWKVM